MLASLYGFHLHLQVRQVAVTMLNLLRHIINYGWWLSHIFSICKMTHEVLSSNKWMWTVISTKIANNKLLSTYILRDRTGTRS